MWDGREASLVSQATDATNGHAQAATPPTPDQVSQIVAFETGVLAAQSVDDHARDLDGAGATGGPEFLPATVAAFFSGINDPLGGNPTGTPFTSVIFTLYDAWASLTGSWENERRVQIARGQAVFNTKPITITGVAGLNDVVGQPTISGFCGTCHDSPNVGNHSVKLPIDIGIAGSGPLDPIKGTGAAPVLDIDGLPVFTVSCDSGPSKGTTYTVTDLAAIVIGGLLLLTRRLKSERIYVEIDWSLLLMFVGLFIIVAGAERALLTPDVLAAANRLHLDRVPALSLATAVLSNLVSNVPAVLVPSSTRCPTATRHGSWSRWLRRWPAISPSSARSRT